MDATSQRDVVVIGGGVAGAGTAHRLAEMGVRCTVIERDGVASHASGFAYGGLSGGIPNGPQINSPLIAYSMGLYPALADALAAETNVDVQYRPRALLRLALSDDEAAALTANLVWQRAQPGYAVERLDAAQVRALEPRVAPETVGALYIEGASDVEPYRLTVALAEAAERRGAAFRTGEVTAIRVAGGRVEGVSVASAAGSERVPCGAVVVAMGPWSAAAGEWLGSPLPVRPLKGQILRLRAPGPPYEISVGHGGNYAMTKPSDGLVWCGTTEEDAGFDESRSTEARDAIAEAALRMLPALADADVALQTACLRPVTPDGAVILGPVPGVEGAYAATGGGRQGIMLGPGMAKALADLIVRGSAEIDLAPYDPGRFVR